MKNIISIILILACAGLWVSCGSNDPQTQGQSNTPNAQAMTSATDDTANSSVYFRAKDLKGTFHTADKWIGKGPVVVNFWGTWCPPCRKEIPDLIRLYKEYQPKGVEIIGLAVNDTPEKVGPFSKQ